MARRKHHRSRSPLGLKPGEALQIAKSVIATVPKAKAFAGIITKDAAQIQTRWRFTASTGQVDRIGDQAEIAGIKLDDYRAAGSPCHWQHDFGRPIGRSVEIDKTGGKLGGVVEFDVGDIRARRDDGGEGRQQQHGPWCVSIGFRPIRWTPMKDAAGPLLFHEVDLLEVALVFVPCCQGAVIHGPVKSLKEQAAECRKQSSEDRKWLAAHEREQRVEHYLATTTPAQRRRERQATLLRLRGAS